MAKRKKYLSGKYTPINPDKYKGTYPIHYRSQWEVALMRIFDKHPDVVSWASESVRIPYKHPITGKTTIYVPDFLAIYEDKNGKRHQEIIEVKPASQSKLTEAKSRYDKISLAVNLSKWSAASSWCRHRGLKFRVINENEIFQNPKKK